MNEQINQSYSSIYSIENNNQNKYYEFISTIQLSSKNNNEKKTLNNNENTNFDIINYTINDENIKIDKIFYFINNLLIKKNYKSVIKFIDNKFNIFENKFKDSLITFFNIKLNCYFKIINNKLNQYKIQNMNVLYNKNSKLSISLEKLFIRVKIEINSFIQKLKEIYNNNNDNTISFYNKEKLIQIYIENLYLLSRFSLIKHFINDSISYCSMAYNLIKDYIKKCKDPNVYNSYSKILLLMSTLLIKNGCYSNALNFLKINFRLIKKEILIKCFNNEENNVKINIKNLSFNIKEKLNKSLLNLVLNFYLTGICYENLNNNTYCVQSYKSANFFCSHFFIENNSKFFKIIDGTYNSFMKNYENIIDHEKFEREKKKKFFEEKLKQNKIEMNKKLLKNNSMQIKKSEKFQKITDFIENQIKIDKHEIPYTINTLENKDNLDFDILESLKFYDDLLSENYKEYVYKNKNFNYNKPKRETIFYLEKYNQKLINKKIKENNSQKFFIKLNNKNNDISNFNSNYSFFSVKNSVLLKQHKNNLENGFFTNKNNNNSNYYSSIKNSRSSISKNLSFLNRFKTFKKSSSNLKLDYNNNIKNNDKDSIINKNNYVLKNKSHSSKNFKNNKNKKISAFEIQKNYCKNLSHRNLHNFSHSLSEYKKIKKYPVNIYYNNKNYKKKIKFLEKIEKREINFQKNLLLIKKLDANDIIKSNEIIDKYQIIKDANCSFLRIKDSVKNEKLNKFLFFFNKKESNEINSYKNLIEKINYEKDKLKDSIVTGLNTKKINKIKELEKDINEIKNERKNKNLNNNNNNYMNKTINIKKELIYKKLGKNYNDINNSCLSNLSKELQEYKIKKSNINKLIKKNIINI